MNLQELNQKFDAREGLTSGQCVLLMKEGRIALTEACLDPETAMKICGPMDEHAEDILREIYEEMGYDAGGVLTALSTGGAYGGAIVVSTPIDSPQGDGWKEAEAWAAKRGWSEQVIGYLTDVIPADETRGSKGCPSLHDVRLN